MDEYFEREALITKFKKMELGKHGSVERLFADGVYAVIAAFPAADVAPVVRCKDCAHAKRYERADGTAGYSCCHPQNIFTYGERWDRVFEPIKEPDDFCSYGEPKEG